MSDRTHRRIETAAEGLGDGIKGVVNVGVFAFSYLMLHDWLHVDRGWSLAAAVVFTLSEIRRPV